MDTNIPYMPSCTNLHPILDAIQKAGAPEAFGLDFLKDLGFTSSNDRAAIKILKFLGFLDSANKPQASYREFMDQHKAKTVLAKRLRHAYDDLFLSDKDAYSKSTDKLLGWFKTKTGAGEAVAKKIATTFKSLASYADFTSSASDEAPSVKVEKGTPTAKVPESLPLDISSKINIAYRIEIQLPDTTNVETYRAIFRAIREELA